MTRAPAIDIHAHFFPEALLEVIDDAGPRFGARVDRTNPRGPVIVVGESRTPPLDAVYWDLDRRRKAMDRQGVDVHALSLTVPMVYWADAAVGLRLARAFNDALVEAHKAAPDRFVGCATLPMQDPVLALAELDRVAQAPGIRAVYLGTNINGRELADPAFEPILARCERERLPVFLHPINVIGGSRLGAYYLTNLLGNPFDTAVAAAYLVFGGVLDRHPRLEICLPHAGGALPYLAGRLGHGQRVRPETRDRTRRPFEHYLRRFTYDTISHAPGALQFLVQTVGADRVMLGSDFCFDMGYARPREVVTRQLKLRRTDQRRILGGTAARLLRLD
ncbi:MAG TPA: amidohydrolase family protein [Candidatus Tectomicrobia bacterium]|nr:amidohydrolase family protein [Candidatus Tectomicrobia bacterium]